MTSVVQLNPGRKDDADKCRFSLLPWEAVREVAHVMTFGARKYDDDNWRRLDNAQERYWDAAMRHLVAWKAGEKRDPESGRNHLAHCASCVLIALALDKDGT